MRHDRTVQPGEGNSDIDDDEHLDFGPRGWLTIGLKGLCGGRGFDDANPFCDSDRPWQVYQDSSCAWPPPQKPPPSTGHGCPGEVLPGRNSLRLV